ncbi:MAG: betaine/proline/choline family ABC transporter ATP-binding protein [Gammaproteobacteria bacterium]|nr:betaine/proline/choline family ABC transporter ATP-binding protein [Gammaproteobacteria bacterium]
MSDTAIEIANVWKIFGANPLHVLNVARGGAFTKQALLEQHDAVVGVADVSLAVKRGEIFCVMGLSGSGKSTLVRHINRLLEPTAGSVIVDGVDVMSLEPPALQTFRNHKVAMVFQNFGLLPHWSVLDNIAMPLEIRAINKNERMRIAAKIVSLVELDGWGNKFAHELSGGMQQRVGLARALAADPDVLLMDEPFSALDPLIRRQLQDEFIKLSAKMNKTTVFITHDLDEAVRVGDRIAIMRDGAVVQIGTAEDIVMHPADDYVADFVAGISRLKIVKANAVMTPVAQFVHTHGPLGGDLRQVPESESLSSLINMAIGDESPIAVTRAEQTVGIVTSRDILRTVIEGADVA